MTYEDIKTETRDQTTWITLSRPEAMNAVRPQTYLELAAAFEAADADRDTRFIVLTGAGRGFCAGDDFNEIFLSEKNHPSKRSNATLARYRSKTGASDADRRFDPQLHEADDRSDQRRGGRHGHGPRVAVRHAHRLGPAQSSARTSCGAA